MPTLLHEKGIRYYFYSNENDEPCHIPVEKGDAEGKIWLEPIIAVVYLHRFTNSEEKSILNAVADIIEAFKKRWYEYFK